jgi:hypothetical protein
MLPPLQIQWKTSRHNINPNSLENGGTHRDPFDAATRGNGNDMGEEV